MTQPCVNPDHFEVIDGAIRPRFHYQWRHAATAALAEVERSYPPVSATAPDEDLAAFGCAWTNDTPIAQRAYALLTRGPSRVSLSANSIGYIETYAGAVAGVSPADPAAETLISRAGCGTSRGVEIGTGNTVYAIAEDGPGQRTLLVGDTITLPPGQTYKVSIRLRFASTAWNSANYSGGNAETECLIATGDARLDLFTYPAM